MIKLITLVIVLAGINACNDTSNTNVTPVEKIDHRSISYSIKFTLSRDVNPIGKNMLKNVLKEELLEANQRINNKLLNAGLPTGTMSIKEK